jgi:hypothetical protein
VSELAKRLCGEVSKSAIERENLARRPSPTVIDFPAQTMQTSGPAFWLGVARFFQRDSNFSFYLPNCSCYLHAFELGDSFHNHVLNMVRLSWAVSPTTTGTGTRPT